MYDEVQFSSAHFSRSVVSDSLRPHELQHARPPFPSPSPGVHSDSRSSSQCCHRAISSSVVPLLLLPPIPPSNSLFQWVNSLHEVAKVLEFQLQHHSLQRNPRADLLQNGQVGSPCSSRDSQESSINANTILYIFTCQNSKVLKKILILSGEKVAQSLWNVLRMLQILHTLWCRVDYTARNRCYESKEKWR